MVRMDSSTAHKTATTTRLCLVRVYSSNLRYFLAKISEGEKSFVCLLEEIISHLCHRNKEGTFYNYTKNADPGYLCSKIRSLEEKFIHQTFTRTMKKVFFYWKVSQRIFKLWRFCPIWILLHFMHCHSRLFSRRNEQSNWFRDSFAIQS